MKNTIAALNKVNYSPPIDARTVAKWRAQLNHCPVILGSATPSLETWLESQANPSLYLSLPIASKIAPYRGWKSLICDGNCNEAIVPCLVNPCVHLWKPCANKGEQAILFVSRRGHSTFVSCRSCGYVLECPHCDVFLSYHHTEPGAQELLRCHYCNYGRIHPKQCPECGSPYCKIFRYWYSALSPKN
jgi:primosomal protein N' (replication factor Y)